MVGFYEPPSTTLLNVNSQIHVTTMTSNERELDKTKNAAAEAAQKAKEVTMASIVQLVDDEAVKNGGRVPYSFVAGVIKEFKSVRAKFDKRHDQPLQKE